MVDGRNNYKICGFAKVSGAGGERAGGRFGTKEKRDEILRSENA